jgi:antitoxin VapB
MVISTEVDNWLPRWNLSLNIKDEEAHQLAKALAEETGETLTGAVKEALRERLQRVRRERGKSKISVEEMLAIGRRIRSRIKGPIMDHGELLYDEKGLPR